MTDRGLPIGALARRSRCAIDTIRYYERVGLLPRPDREGRFRRYTEADVARVAFVRRARELGFPLEQVRALLRLAALGDGVGGAGACAEAQAIARAHLADLRARIADLRAVASVLDTVQRACADGALGACPVIASLSDAA